MAPSSVVLPLPLGPGSVTNSPGSICKSTLSTAVNRPKRLLRPRIEMALPMEASRAGTSSREPAIGARNGCPVMGRSMRKELMEERGMREGIAGTRWGHVQSRRGADGRVRCAQCRRPGLRPAPQGPLNINLPLPVAASAAVPVDTAPKKPAPHPLSRNQLLPVSWLEFVAATGLVWMPRVGTRPQASGCARPHGLAPRRHGPRGNCFKLCRKKIAKCLLQMTILRMIW
jgi:hypothetical protein